MGLAPHAIPIAKGWDIDLRIRMLNNCDFVENEENENAAVQMEK